MHRIYMFAFTLALGLALWACDDGNTSTNNVNNVNNVNNTNNLNNVNNVNNLPGPVAGELELAESRQFGYANSSLSGVIGEGGFPVWQEETAVEGDCRLLRHVVHFCEDYCEGVCVAENVCEPWPSFDSAGFLMVDGAKAIIEVQPGPWGFNGFENGYSWWGETTDLFDDLDVLSASFVGSDDVPAFSASASGVEPLELTTVQNDEISLSNDAGTVFEWTPGSTPGTRIRIRLNANNFGHGAPYEAIIECDTADDGSLTIPQALVRDFPDTYRWEYCAGSDCPLSYAFRYRSGTADLGGHPFVFRVGSAVGFFILHELPQKGE